MHHSRTPLWNTHWGGPFQHSESQWCLIHGAQTCWREQKKPPDSQALGDKWNFLYSCMWGQVQWSSSRPVGCADSGKPTGADWTAPHLPCICPAPVPTCPLPVLTGKSTDNPTFLPAEEKASSELTLPAIPYLSLSKLSCRLSSYSAWTTHKWPARWIE